jgi:NADPH-dependent 2,4-dienoyl-CoA reductase/sulfur reductase-like enzyme
MRFDEKRKQTRRTASLRRDSARGVAGEEQAAYPCPALPFSGCLIEHEHENDDSMIKSGYDVVILGAGHNGLVAASYLGRAGLSVLLLEKNDYIGGATTSQKSLSRLRGATVPLLISR